MSFFKKLQKEFEDFNPFDKKKDEPQPAAGMSFHLSISFHLPISFSPPTSLRPSH